MLPASHYKERERAKAQTRAIKACKDPASIRVDTWLGGYRGLFPDERSEATRYYQANKLAKFRRKYGERTMSSITVIEAQAWELANPGHWRWLNHAWDYAVLMQVAPMNIWKFVVKPPRTTEKRRAPTEEELAVILENAIRTPYLEHFIRVAMHTGARLTELTRVRRSDVDLSARRMILHGKGSKTRTVALLGGSYDAMLSQFAHREQRGWQGPVLPGPSSGHPSPAVFVNEPRPGVHLLWKSNTMAASWRGIREDYPHGIHGLRHYAAHWMRSSGVDPLDIAIQLGHTDKDGRPKAQLVERVYARPPAPDLDDVFERIAQAVG
jgi:integrase